MLEIYNTIEDTNKKKLALSFIGNKKIKRYALGRNKNSEYLMSMIKIDGIIDDFSDLVEWGGMKVLRSSQIIEKDYAIVVSCSLAIYSHSAKKNLLHAGFKNILDYLELVNYTDIGLKVNFINDAQKDIEKNFDKYNTIFNKIEELESKKVFSNLINFKKSRDLSYTKEYKVDEIGQYFEDFLDLKENEVFVDAGGFDGQTSLEFIKHCPEYNAVYIFEPDSKNLKLAKENLAKYKNINFISKGLSNQKDTLRFDTGSGSASSISKNGSIEIEVDTLDALVDEKVTFIKMDIEGAEGLAIKGMKNHILKDHPKMAISVYHKVDDFWKIPEQILAIRADYDIYMRHYTEGTDETVMFFMPKSIST